MTKSGVNIAPAAQPNSAKYSSMTRAIMRLTFLSATLSLLPSATWAQDQTQPVSVYFEPVKGGEFTRLNKAIQSALAEPPFQLEAKPGTRTVIVSVPEKIDVQHKPGGATAYTFTIAFSRDGGSLGQSQQSCGADRLSDCTDQIVLDVKSAAAPR